VQGVKAPLIINVIGTIKMKCFIFFIPCITIYEIIGDTNKYKILKPMYFLYYLAPTCFGTVAILRKLTQQLHQNLEQYII